MIKIHFSFFLLEFLKQVVFFLFFFKRYNHLKIYNLFCIQVNFDLDINCGFTYDIMPILRGFFCLLNLSQKYFYKIHLGSFPYLLGLNFVDKHKYAYTNKL